MTEYICKICNRNQPGEQMVRLGASNVCFEHITNKPNLWNDINRSDEVMQQFVSLVIQNKQFGNERKTLSNQVQQLSTEKDIIIKSWEADKKRIADLMKQCDTKELEAATKLSDSIQEIKLDVWTYNKNMKSTYSELKTEMAGLRQELKLGMGASKSAIEELKLGNEDIIEELKYQAEANQKNIISEVSKTNEAIIRQADSNQVMLNEIKHTIIDRLTGIIDEKFKIFEEKEQEKMSAVIENIRNEFELGDKIFDDKLTEQFNKNNNVVIEAIKNIKIDTGAPQLEKINTGIEGLSETMGFLCEDFDDFEVEINKKMEKYVELNPPIPISIETIPISIEPIPVKEAPIPMVEAVEPEPVKKEEPVKEPELMPVKETESVKVEDVKEDVDVNPNEIKELKQPKKERNTEILTKDEIKSRKKAVYEAYNTPRTIPETAKITGINPRSVDRSTKNFLKTGKIKATGSKPEKYVQV